MGDARLARATLQGRPRLPLAGLPVCTLLSAELKWLCKRPALPLSNTATKATVVVLSPSFPGADAEAPTARARPQRHTW